MSYRVIDAEAHQFIAWVNCERKIAKWLIKSCTVRMCCKCYFPILTLKGNICLLEMTIGRLNDRASPGTSLLRNGAAGHGESVHKAQTKDHFGPLPNGDGGGRGGRGLSVQRRGSALLMITPDCTYLSDRAHSKGRWQIIQVQSVLGNVRSVRCAMQ